MLKFVISLAKSLALMVMVGKKSASGLPLGTRSRSFMFCVVRSPKKRHITLAADTCKTLVLAQPVKNDAGQFLFRLSQPLAGADTFGLSQAFFDEFLFMGLNGKISLSKGDLVLCGIAVLGDQVAGVSRQCNIFDFPLCAGAEVHHFADMRKMVAHPILGVSPTNNK